MAKYNLSTLLHREYSWAITLPDGSVQSGKAVREIPIRIPKIQRDYAEGRVSETIERKRYSLVNDMLDVVYGIREELSFDFIYGYIMNNSQTVKGKGWQNALTCPNPAFEPLDGQQRLTTLFLLYWLFGRAETLRSKDGHSLFVYETRDTSEEFCHWLVNQDAEKLIKEWIDTVEKIKKANKVNKEKWYKEKNSAGVVDPYINQLRFPLSPTPSLFDYMQSLDAFKWDWHDDPNIHSMLTVLESAYRYLVERGLSYDKGISDNSNLDKISFMLLDELVCDGDQLFEKMNARGKALTSFEILKSSFEEEMERQELPVTDSVLTDRWRQAIDGKWIDFCWDTSEIGLDPKLDTIRKVEERLEKLLVRMAGKTFFMTDITYTSPSDRDARNYGALFSDSIFKSNNVIDLYFEYAQFERSVGGRNLSNLDFSRIYNDLENLIFDDPVTKKKRDASSLLPQWNRPGNNNTLLDDFLRDDLTHDTRVMVYAMFAYLEIVPASILSKNLIEKSNFIDWMRFIRNVFLNHNKSSRIDSVSDVKSAIRAIDAWLTEYKKSFRTNSPKDVLKLILNHIKTHSNSQEQARLEEEAIKADLRINGTNGISAADWEKSILKAEANYYLWGQIIAPLSWSKIGNTYDKALFDEYVVYLDKIFNGNVPDKQSVDFLLIQMMLCYDDYRHNLKDGLGSLGRLNNNRDYSWKQYLRKRDKTTGYYGVLFKRLLDAWRKAPNLSFEELLKQEISSNKSNFSVQEWQYYIVNISSPDILKDIFNDIRSDSRYVYNDPNGHTYLFKSDTLRTLNRYELLTTYLSYETDLFCSGVWSSYPAHTYEESGAHVDFTMPGGDIIRLSPEDKGLYKIERLPVGSQNIICLFQNLDVKTVETELKNLKVIQHL